MSVLRPRFAARPATRNIYSAVGKEVETVSSYLSSLSIAEFTFDVSPPVINIQGR